MVDASIPSRQFLFTVQDIHRRELVTAIAQRLILMVIGSDSGLVRSGDHGLTWIDCLASVRDVSNFVFLHLTSQLAFIACRCFEKLQLVGTHLQTTCDVHAPFNTTYGVFVAGVLGIKSINHTINQSINQSIKFSICIALFKQSFQRRLL